MKTLLSTVFILILFSLAAAAAGAPEDARAAPEDAGSPENVREAPENGCLVVRAAWIYVGDGTVIENGMILIRDGKIVEVGASIEAPEDASEISSGTGVVTPGLIDAASTAGVINGNSWTEHSSEVVPHLSVLDAVDLRSRDFERLVREGVTAVYVTPGSGSVIGCRGAVVKTAGPIDKRVLIEKGSVKAAMGRDPLRRGAYNQRPYWEATFMTRRPTTRMGVVWVFRDAFYSAKRYAKDKNAARSSFEEPALKTLVDVLEGRVRMRIQTRQDNDIWSAIRLSEEFGIDIVLEECTEAYRCLPELKKKKIPIIFGPIFSFPSGYRGRTGEANRPCLNTAGLIREAGLPMALTAGDLTGEGSLPHQAGYAIRAGLSFDAALESVTAAPAKLLGVEKRVGLLRSGLDADLVLWNGKPFDPASRPITVVIDGKPVHVLGLAGADLEELNEQDN